MTRRPPHAPPPRRLRGPGHRVALLVAIALAACDPAPEPEPRLDPELVQALGLTGEEVVHTVALGGGRSEEHVAPPLLRVADGDLVEFVTVDRRVHAVRFVTDSMAPEGRAFLLGTGQDASPPLVARGSRFVVTFEKAPAGRYPFVSSGYGEESGGVIIVGGNP